MIILLIVSGKNHSNFYDWDDKCGKYAYLNVKEVELALK